MKSPVVPFRDPAAAAKQRAKLSQEGSFIPIFINIIYYEKISYRQNTEQIRRKENLKKAGAHQWPAFKIRGPVSVPSHRS